MSVYPLEFEANPGGTLAASAEARLRQDILSGALKPGEKLRIEVVCARYGVGASPVREALSRLSAEGLVDRRDQRGFYVGDANLQDLRDLVETRCKIEGLALRETLSRRTPEWEEQLVLIMHRLSRIGPGSTLGRTPAWEALHEDFHDILINQAGHRLIRICQSLRAQSNRYRRLSIVADPARPDLDEHAAIVEAVLANHADEAERLLTKHYYRTLEAIEASGWMSD